MAQKVEQRHASPPGAAALRTHFTPRVIAVIMILLVIFLGWTFFWLLYAERQALYESRQTVLSDNVSLASSLCRQLQLRARAGEFTPDEAQAQARSLLGGMRYGPQNAGYFYVLDRSGVMLVHPMRPSLVGSDARYLADANGDTFIAKLLTQTESWPAGFVSYRYSWHGGSTKPTPRLAYGARFDDWNWVIVSEMSTADIEERIMSELSQQAVLLLLLTIVLALVLSITLKRLVLSGVDRLIDVAQRLRTGDLSARVPVVPTDEMGALAISINEMAEGIQRRDEQLRLTQRTAVFALAKLAEARDNETGGHLLRVREYVSVLARALRSRNGWAANITEEFIQDIYDSSMLHDIGKVAVPDGILLKPDTLDEGEMAIMMSHTLIGANTIRLARQRMKVNSGFLTMAEQIARSHHEHWDGSGYSEGLAGEKIPLAARIFTVADVYDALTTARPYKPAYSHEKALELMMEERGRTFDPRVYDAFIAASKTFDRIRRDFAEP